METPKQYFDYISTAAYYDQILKMNEEPSDEESYEEHNVYNTINTQILLKLIEIEGLLSYQERSKLVKAGEVRSSNNIARNIQRELQEIESPVKELIL